MKFIKMIVLSDDDLLRDSTYYDRCVAKTMFADHVRVEVWPDSTEELVTQLDEINPRIILLDWYREKAGTAAWIARIHEKSPDCRVIVCGDGEDAALLRTLFGLKVDGFLPKPVREEELIRTLNQIAETMRKDVMNGIGRDISASMQTSYFEKTMYEGDEQYYNLTFLNNVLCAKLRPGSFRVIVFRLDGVDGVVPDLRDPNFQDSLHVLHRLMKFEIGLYLSEYCYDMLFEFRSTGILAMFNYPPDRDTAFLAALEELSVDLGEVTVSKFSLSVTICVGGEYSDLFDARKSREEAFGATWIRMKQGSGKVLFYRKKYDSQQLYQETLDEVAEQLEISAQTLDKMRFHRAVEQLFNLPEYVLLDHKSRSYILNFVNRFFELNGDNLSRFLNKEKEKKSLERTLSFSNTLEMYHNNLILTFDRLFDVLADDAETKSDLVLRKALKYIKENYDQPLNAEILAELVNLSPVYFSYLFKKNIGINMIDYITGYRMEQAKKLLFETSLPIGEVACSVGFQDQRYFSKRFKQFVGQTPTEYRKMK